MHLIPKIPAGQGARRIASAQVVSARQKLRPVSLVLLALCLTAFTSVAAAEPPSPNVTPILEPDKQGAGLAARLRNAAPAEPSQFKGTLVITTRDDQTASVAVESRLNPSPTNWLVVYQSVASAKRPAQTLTIIHQSGSSNIYLLDDGTRSILPNPHPLGVAVTNLIWPFAGGEFDSRYLGSDFWLCDLGLEFLHWPQQRVLKHEMRRSRSCWVLESVTPTPIPGGYARVVSWVDVEHDGILRAEAYDQSGKLVKEFTLGSLRKVDGRYQLESMKMRNVRTGSETELKFDLHAKP